jgi:protein-tyrosine-phosphatase
MTERPPSPEPRRRLLFVCVENGCRSQMAEAFARLHGGGRVEAHSADVRPAGRVHPKAVGAMREAGIGLAGHRSKGLGEVPSVEFDAAVTMAAGDLAVWRGAESAKPRLHQAGASDSAQATPGQLCNKAGRRPSSGACLALRQFTKPLAAQVIQDATVLDLRQSLVHRRA